MPAVLEKSARLKNSRIQTLPCLIQATLQHKIE